MPSRAPLTLVFALLLAFVATVPCGCAPCGPLDAQARETGELASRDTHGCCPGTSSSDDNDAPHGDNDLCAHCTDAEAIKSDASAGDHAAHTNPPRPLPSLPPQDAAGPGEPTILAGVASRAWTKPPPSDRPPASVATGRRLAQLQILRC